MDDVIVQDFTCNGKCSNWANVAATYYRYQGKK